MNVTFKGMQNVGCYYKEYNDDPENRKDRIAIQLNNKGNKDLDDFKEVLEIHPGLQEPDFLDMEFRSYPNRIDPDRQITDVFVNSKKLELNNKNLAIFAKINNLLKRIAKGEETPTSMDYIKSDECLDRFNAALHGKHRDDKIAHLQNLHYEGNTRIGSKEISERLTNIIRDFAESDVYPFTEIKSVSGFSYEDDAESINRLQLDLKPEDSKIFKDFLSQYIPISGKEDHFSITVDVYRVPGLKNQQLSINHIPIAIKNENFPMLRKVSELLNKVINTKDEIQFPRDYLSEKSFNDISKGVLQDDYLGTLYMIPKGKREDRGINLKMITSNDEAKDIAAKINYSIKKAMNEYFN